MTTKKDIDQLFTRITEQKHSNEDIQGSSLTFWKDAYLRFKKNKASLIAGYILLALSVLMFILPLFGAYGPSNYDGAYQEAQYNNLPPKIPVLEWLKIADGVKDGKDFYAEAEVPEGTYFLFGTDNFGRDLFTRTFKGTQVSIGFGLAAALIDVILGVSLGGISGFFGRNVDIALQRFAEVIGSIPRLIWVVLLIMYVGQGITALLIAIAINGWIPMYRIVRAQTLKYKEQEFVLSSRTLGAGSIRLIQKHILPNMLGMIIIWIMFTIPSAIFYESYLSFLGIGLKVPMASLGTLISDGRDALTHYPYVLFIPALLLSFVMLMFNLLADGLRDAFDPKMRGGDGDE